VLQFLGIVLLGGFSFVLVDAGYWLASLQLERRRIWWGGIWTPDRADGHPRHRHPGELDAAH